MSKGNCPFCNQKLRELSFCESNSFLAIYNKAPILPGHSMIIPKRHISSFIKLDAELRYEMIELSVKAIKMLQKTFPSKSFNWTIQEGVEAGQTINHLHMHIIPRTENDLPEPGDWYPNLERNYKNLIIDSELRPQYSDEELLKIVKKIKQLNS